YAQPQNNGYAQPQNNGYAQPQNGSYAQPQSGGYAQPQSGGYAQPDTEPLRTEAGPQAEAADLNAQAENLKLLKKLLDEGILTPEEFEAKKKDILGL
ncbi:MAG: SHOCT domain-containing protein, partial [Clostridia bacterium]